MADLAGANGTREVFKVVGTPNLPGKLSRSMATGGAKYGVDYVLPDMLHAKFLRSPYANARVISVNREKAMKIPGVALVLTWEDEEILNLVSFGESFGAKKPWLDNIADREGVEVAAIVVAENEDICFAALEALEPEYEVLPHVVDLIEGRQENAPVIRPEVYHQPAFGAPGGKETPPKQGNVYYSNMYAGDVEAGFAEADKIIEYKLYMPAYSVNMPNTPGSVAWWEDEPYQGEGKNLHIEGAVREKNAISSMYNMPQEKTIQEGLFQGGKYCDWGLRKSQEITPLLSKLTGRPVRCVDAREDSYDFLTNERYIEMKVGFKNDGSITAVLDHSIADNGARGSSAFGNVGDQTQGPYNTLKCKNVNQLMEIVDSNRGIMYVSGQHCPFNWDTVTMAIHIIAEELDMDPIDVARLNLHGPTSKDDTNPVPSFDACIEAGRKLMNWDWHKAGAKRLPDGRLHGASFRYQMCPRHSGAVYNCKLEYRNGMIHMPTQGPVFGAYVVEANAMVVAEEMGVSYDGVSIDYDYRQPFAAYGGGSDGTTASAWTMKECANLLKRQVLESAIKTAENPPPPFMFGAPTKEPEISLVGRKPEELDIVDGKVVIASDPAKGIPLAEATSENLFATYSGRPPLSAWSTGQMGKVLDTMNTAYCEVAVDTETGEVEILRFGTVADPGKVIRPISLESQIDQVMYFSQGCQLLEDFVYDKKTGVKLNNNMLDCRKPGMLDVPRVDRQFLETRAGNAVYGASGISHSLANTHLVIIAIYNATGVWVDPPATPDKVLKALGKIIVNL